MQLIAAAIGRGISRGEWEAGTYLVEQVKRRLGRPTPVRREQSGRLVAVRRATPGAAPREVSGALARAIMLERRVGGVRVLVDPRSGAIKYAESLQNRGHMYMYATDEDVDQVTAIIAEAIADEIRKLG
jgi:hypothetical protein